MDIKEKIEDIIEKVKSDKDCFECQKPSCQAANV